MSAAAKARRAAAQKEFRAAVEAGRIVVAEAEGGWVAQLLEPVPALIERSPEDVPVWSGATDEVKEDQRRWLRMMTPEQAVKILAGFGVTRRVLHAATAPTSPKALDALRAAMRGPRTIPARLHLKLCKPCNRRAAEAGDMVSSQLGVEVCLPCADAIDSYLARRRRAQRNKRKGAKA